MSEELFAGTSNQTTAEQPSDESSAERRIVLVEDSVDCATMVRHVVDGFSHAPDLVRVETGRAAIDWLDKADRPPALVLLDLDLPDLHGHEVLAKVRSYPWFATTPVIVFSSSVEPETVKNSYRNGANSHVPKPVDFDAFRRNLEHVLDYWLAVDATGPRTDLCVQPEQP